MEAKNIYVHKKIDTPINQTRYIYTFDGKDAKEIDDALSITIEDGIYTLGVHIASPSNYIQDNSILIDEAIRRTTSIYLQNDVIPLYPTILSTQLMSLNENQKTYAMSYYFKIDQITGELIDFQIKNEIIQINQNLTYDIFNTILEHGSNDQNLEQTVINLNLISSILKQIYNENAIYKEFHNDKHKNNGMSVIESAMIYTNYNIARLFSERQIPFIYRCHTIDKKITKKLSLLQERLKENNINNQIVTDIEMIKNIFPPAYYTLNNQGHFGLGIKYYTHSTSPLRRYADNIANKCINRFILNDYTEEDIKLMEEYIEITTEILNNKRYSINTFEEEYKKIKKYQN